MGRQEWSRRDLLKAAGAVAGASLILPSLPAAEAPKESDYPTPARPATCVVIGAGNRGNVYAGYAARFPKEMKIVGVAEPIPERNAKMARAHAIPDEHRFPSWEYVFQRPKFADVAIISTPDRLHHGPAMAALAEGYDLLLEKPIARTWKDCKDILMAARKHHRIVAVCHVMRYAAYFKELRRIVVGGEISDVVSVQHLEPIEIAHMTHSFVRGNWRNTEVSAPILLTKSCHDMDYLRWLVDRPCTRVSSFGSLTLFRPEMAPRGAALRCTDNCPLESTCPFSAIRIYVREKRWDTYHLQARSQSEADLLEALRTGPYGRCVWHCDNNVCDHQITNLEFEGNVTAAFSLEGLASYAGRRTRVMGTAGDIVGDEITLATTDFSTRKTRRWDASQVSSGHGGGDYGLVRDFVQAVSRQDASLLSSTLEASMESHLMCFQAEESRTHEGKSMKVEIERA